MNRANLLLIVGIACLGLGVYSLFLRNTKVPDTPSPTTPITSTTVVPRVFNPDSSGAGWMVDDYDKENCLDLPNLPASVKRTDTDEVRMIVPANDEDGVSTNEFGDGLLVKAGDKLLVSVYPGDKIKFASHLPCATAQGLYGYYDPAVDSPYKNSVGGGEIAFGEFTDNLDLAHRDLTFTEHIIWAKKSGAVRFRVIDRKGNYNDNSGYYTITVTIIKKIKNGE